MSRPPDRRPFEPLAAFRNVIDNAEIACDTDSSAPSIGQAQFSIGLGTGSCWYGLLASITLESVETVQPFCRDPDSEKVQNNASYLVLEHSYSCFRFFFSFLAFLSVSFLWQFPVGFGKGPLLVQYTCQQEILGEQ